MYFILDMEWSLLTVESRIEEEREFDDTLDGNRRVVFDMSFSRSYGRKEAYSALLCM